jgi:type I pantothenate kinase
MTDLRDGVSPFLSFPRDRWSQLRAATPLTLSQGDLAEIQGLNERLDLEEVQDVYLPISRLLDLSIAAAQELYRARATFLGSTTEKVPFMIGIAGSVAVGKSTTARLLQTLLSRWPGHPRVDLVTTDGFLFPNQVLEARGAMSRKGFPESYDLQALVRFVSDVKSGRGEVRAPVYSHLSYDIVPGASQVVRSPDIVILEGLNILHAGSPEDSRQRIFVSDYLDFSIFVDADEDVVRRWYVERFLKLRDTAFQDPKSYFHRYAVLTDREAEETANAIWREINLVNLRGNIAPTRGRAQLILRKGEHHRVEELRLRRL